MVKQNWVAWDGSSGRRKPGGRRGVPRARSRPRGLRGKRPLHPAPAPVRKLAQRRRRNDTHHARPLEPVPSGPRPPGAAVRPRGLHAHHPRSAGEPQRRLLLQQLQSPLPQHHRAATRHVGEARCTAARSRVATKRKARVARK